MVLIKRLISAHSRGRGVQKQALHLDASDLLPPFLMTTILNTFN